MKIAVYGRNIEATIANYELILNRLKANNNTVYIYSEFADFLNSKIDVCRDCQTFSSAETLSSDIDFFVSLGGDGTFLESAHFVCKNNIPVIGINTGSLGFLASISINKLDDVLDELKRREYTIEERTMLQIIANNKININAHALNEIGIQRTKPSLISTSVHINGELLSEYWSDGLILATPTGSTAYSMSVGGPIVVPTAASFVISPIAPHNLSIRPMVIPDDSEISITVKTRGEQVMITADNQMFYSDSGDKIIVKKSPYKVNIIKPNSVNFYTTLKNKLFWGFDPRVGINVYQH